MPDPRRGRGARPAVDPAPPRRAAVRAQRLRLRPQQVPRARRHDRGVPRVRGARRAHLSSSATRSSASRRSTRSPARSSRSSTGSSLFPASHYVTDEERLKRGDRGHRGRAASSGSPGSSSKGKLLEAQRLRMRTTYDLEMLREVGVVLRASRTTRCTSTAAAPGQPPYTLLDYFPDDYAGRRRRVARRRSRSCTASSKATGRARRRSSSTASGCRRRWTTGRCASRSSSSR